ncbi:MAG TPA: serine hydrolase domain-containing protein [Sphingomicrobium sp.]|nr:serine hydrolase domain-containing protein [Sphingomicrobium sp.]
MRKPVRLFLIASAAATAAPFLGAANEPSKNDELARCYERQAALVPFSGVVLAKDASTNFVTASGYMDEAQSRPISADTRFRLASVQKVLTKTAIGLLVEQGKLGLDDPVGKYVPDLPDELASATIQQLLDHRSGAAAFTRLSPEVQAALLDARTTSDLVDLVASQPTSFRPGERQEYSNGGFFLLGAVIERISGKSYGDYLAAAIFRPLGMTATGLTGDTRTASPLSKMAAEMRSAAAIPMGSGERRASPAGDGVSTASDLARLGAALAGDKFLSRTTRERLFRPRDGVWRIGQGGGTLGSNTDLAAFPDNGWVIVVLSNFDPPAGELMAEALRGVVLGKGCTPLSEKDRPSPLRRRPPSS